MRSSFNYGMLNAKENWSWVLDRMSDGTRYGRWSLSIWTSPLWAIMVWFWKCCFCVNSGFHGTYDICLNISFIRCFQSTLPPSENPQECLQEGKNRIYLLLFFFTIVLILLGNMLGTESDSGRPWEHTEMWVQHGATSEKQFFCKLLWGTIHTVEYFYVPDIVSQIKVRLFLNMVHKNCSLDVILKIK